MFDSVEKKILKQIKYSYEKLSKNRLGTRCGYTRDRKRSGKSSTYTVVFDSCFNIALNSLESRGFIKFEKLPAREECVIVLAREFPAEWLEETVPQVTVPELVEEEEDDNDNDDNDDEPPPKRRGRPPKKPGTLKAVNSLDAQLDSVLSRIEDSISELRVKIFYYQEQLSIFEKQREHLKQVIILSMDSTEVQNAGTKPDLKLIA